MEISWKGNEGGGVISVTTIDGGRVVGAFSRSVCVCLVFSGVGISV